MDAEALIGTVLRGALGARGKRHTRALRFLTGRGGLMNAGTLLTAAGVAWGLYETLADSSERVTAAPTSSPSRPVAAPAAAPPPIPGTPASAAAPAPAAADSLPPTVARVVRLAISAAKADGTLSPREEEVILANARAAGAESLVRAELDRPTPLAAIVAGVTPEQRNDLYTLAFAIVRADEAVSGAERIYLAQLAHQLGLTAAETSSLEATATERIQAAPSPEP